MQLSDFVNFENLNKFVASLPKSTKIVGKITKTLTNKCYNTFEEYVKEENVKPLKGGRINAISYSHI